MNSDLIQLQRAVTRILVPFVCLHVPVIAGIAWFVGNPWIPPGLFAALVAIVAAGAAIRSSTAKSTRLTVAVALVVMVSLILVACQGTSWQSDLHMYYFATLAILALYCDRDVVLAGAAATAIHHLGLNFLAPFLVFPGGAHFFRVVLHAGIVIMETGALVWMTSRIVDLLAMSACNLAASVTQSDIARAQEKATAADLRHQREAEMAKIEVERLAISEAQERVVASIGTGLRGLAVGDLAIRLNERFAPSYEGLRQDFNTTVGQLHAMIHGIVDRTAGLKSGTGDIANAAKDLSDRTEQQAASLEETAAALDEITATVRKTAAGAEHAHQVVLKTRDNARHSGDTVREAVVAMGSITQSSREIGNIIGFIDEIAFQTNLLALNAGVEAVRAGDAGRGFAVVASEVRALAQRSAEAAKEIKALISTLGQHVDKGVKLVSGTGGTLEQIIHQVDEIESVIRDITSSASEQASGLAQVNTAIIQMDHVTQQNAAMVEQSTAASLSLARDAEDLSQLASRFELGAVAGPTKNPSSSGKALPQAARRRVA